MKIGVDARVLTQKELRGISNYLFEILRAWPEKQDEFLLFYESGKISKAVFQLVNEIKCIQVSEPPGTRIKTWFWLGMPQVLKKINLDVLWCPANIPIPFIKNFPQIVTIHDTLLQEKFRKHNMIDHFFYKILVPFFVRRYTNKIITVSKFSKNRIKSLFKVQDRSINVIYNGIVKKKSFLTKDEVNIILRKKGIKSKPFIYALGAISPWKNTDILLKAFAILSKNIPNFYMIITGIQKEGLLHFRALANKLNINEKVYIMGFVSNKTQAALYKAADLFVYPSLFEGFGFPPLEAMAFGCPVIASDKASIPEVVGNGALLVDCTSAENLANAIKMVLEDHQLKKQLITQGFSIIKQFTWTKSAQQHCQILRCTYNEKKNINS